MLCSGSWITQTFGVGQDLLNPFRERKCVVEGAEHGITRCMVVCDVEKLVSRTAEEVRKRGFCFTVRVTDVEADVVVPARVEWSREGLLSALRGSAATFTDVDAEISSLGIGETVCAVLFSARTIRFDCPDLLLLVVDVESGTLLSRYTLMEEKHFLLSPSPLPVVRFDSHRFLFSSFPDSWRRSRRRTRMSHLCRLLSFLPFDVVENILEKEEDSPTKMKWKRRMTHRHFMEGECSGNFDIVTAQLIRVLRLASPRRPHLSILSYSLLKEEERRHHYHHLKRGLRLSSTLLNPPPKTKRTRSGCFY